MGIHYPHMGMMYPYFQEYVMTPQKSSNSAYFNLTCEGVGFLNRPRIVKGKKVPEYFAVTISASRGDAGEKTRFDVRVVGSEAKILFQKMLEEFPALLSKDFKKRPTVVVGFRVGDIQPTTFESKGAITATIDGRLLKFKFIRVSGELWYEAQKQWQQLS